jgi:hypothetical protein
LAANAKAAREALAFMQKLAPSPERVISRPNVQQPPEKPQDVSRREKPSPTPQLVDASPVVAARGSEDRPAVAQKQAEKVPTRPRAEVKPVPRRIEALEPAIRPETVRSAPRWGVHRFWPVRVVSTSQTSEVELDETPPPE